MHMSWKNALLREDVHTILKREAKKRNESISDFIKELLQIAGYIGENEGGERR